MRTTITSRKGNRGDFKSMCWIVADRKLTNYIQDFAKERSHSLHKCDRSSKTGFGFYEVTNLLRNDSARRLAI